MKEKIALIGSVLLLSNISFISAEVLFIPTERGSILQEHERQSHQSIVAILTNKGLDEDAAQVKADSNLHALNDVMMANAAHALQDISSTQIETYVANEVLFNRPCHLDDYGTLVSMVQNIKQEALTNEMLGRLNEVSTLNRELIFS